MYITIVDFYVLKNPPRVSKNFRQIKNRALPTFPPVLHWSIMSGAAFDF